MPPEVTIALRCQLDVPSVPLPSPPSYNIHADIYFCASLLAITGNFVDLVQRRFYDSMPFQKVEQLTVQTGSPKGSGADDGGGGGFVDPATGRLRTVPLELFYKSDSQPVYGITSDDDLRATETMALPFQAYGALGMARGNEEPGK